MATIRSMTVYPDASGAPAVVEHDGFSFSFDMLGEMKWNAIDGRSHGFLRPARERAIAACRSLYAKELASRVDADWISRNAAMYRE